MSAILHRAVLEHTAERESVLRLGASGDGPRGRGFFKGGHNDWTGNMLVCLEEERLCAVILETARALSAPGPELTATRGVHSFQPRGERMPVAPRDPG